MQKLQIKINIVKNLRFLQNKINQMGKEIKLNFHQIINSIIKNINLKLDIILNRV
jgi:hypothetical protein